MSELDGATWHKCSYSGSDNGCVERGKLRSSRQAVRGAKTVNGWPRSSMRRSG
ncbi:DUF397 domain-containing protein [Streptomyces sp. 3N207]|uniref:DUF397 domain-containing protein n=1 Tax=Streptomyces sp. 3N207 TaxID=3457417 RepID=UPI003FD48AE5